MLKRLFDGLHWSEVLEYGSLLLTLVLMIISWRLGIIGLALVAVAAGVKMIATRKVGNSALCGVGRWSMVLMMAYWAWCLASGLSSADRTMGLERATTRLPLLVLPLVALLSDMRYLTAEREVGTQSRVSLLSSLVLTQWGLMTAIAAVCLMVAAVRLALGASMSQVMDMHYFPTHHSYAALYATVAMGSGWFLLHSTMKAKRGNTAAPKGGCALPTWLLLGSEVLLAIMVVMINSRAGILYIALLTIVALADIVICGRRWKSALITILVVAAAVVVIYKVTPPEYRRFTKDLQEIRAGKDGNVRVTMMRCGLDAIQGHWLTGLGLGDYEVGLQEQYGKHNFSRGLDHQWGTHNQFLETLLQSGLIGLALMVAFVLLPLACKDSKQYWVRLTVLAMGVAIYFESMLGRQMGVQFIGLMYVFLALSSGGIKETKEDK